MDIGANMGLVTIVMLSCVGTEGEVHAFEPNPRLQRLLSESLSRCSSRNVVLHPFALGASPDRLDLFVPDDNAGAGSLTRRSSGVAGTVVQVEVRTLSDVLMGRITRSPRLVKIDVEDHEPEVLRGASDLFRSYPPDAVLFELNLLPGHVGTHPTLEILQELGYRFLQIPRALFRMKLRILDAAIGSPLTFDGHDILAVRQGPIGDEIARRVRVSG